MIVLRYSVCQMLSQQTLLVQSQEQKHEKKVWNMFKVDMKSPEQDHWRCSGVFIVNFEYNSHLFLLLLWTRKY